MRFQEQVIINANLWGITESKRNGLWLNRKPSLVTLGFNDQQDKGRKTRAATDLAILAPDKVLTSPVLDKNQTNTKSF